MGGAGTSMSGVKLAKDSITYCTSGLVDRNKGTCLSYLQKAIKSLNQLRMIEDSLVIYRLSRAPERRIFYIDVGNLPKIKAEQYLRDVMSRYRNKLVYDSGTGEVFVLDGADNETKISPHNDNGEWEYFSRNTTTGKTVRINMEAMIRDLETFTGNRYIESE